MAKKRQKLRIGFIGSRGIPAIYGGFETFVEKVAIGLAKNPEFEVSVVGDPEQYERFKGKEEHEGVKLFYTKYYKSSTPNLFYFDSALKLRKHADIIYSCGVGGAYSTLLVRCMGKTYLTNPDGVGWQRDKFSRLKKTLLWTMFYVAHKHSNYMVPDSVAIGEYFSKKFNRRRKTIPIEYGGELNDFLGIDNDETRAVLSQYGLNKNQYHLVVARLEPENKVHMIIEGYLKRSGRKYPLIVVGNKIENSYVAGLLKNESENVRFVGGIYGENKLKIARANALTYFHGHTVGGTNPSLLEAMGSKNLCVCHANMFNKEVTGGFGLFFEDAKDVDLHIEKIEVDPYSSELDRMRNDVYARVTKHYNWERVTRLYSELFHSI